MDEAGSQNAELKGLVLATIGKLRAKLLDLTMANRLLNFKPSEKSRSHIRLIADVPEVLFEKLEAGEELEFAWIEEPELEPADERTPEFRKAVEEAKTTDGEYIEQLEKLGKRPTRRQLSAIDRGLRDRVRITAGLTPRAKPSVADRGRELGFDPSYDLPRESEHTNRTHRDSKIQTLLYRETMETKLAAIRETDKTLLDDAGVSALYGAFGAVEWYESSESHIPVFAPLLFVPVEIRRVLEQGVYRYVLVVRDDDIEVNQAFGELMRETYSIELPSWNPEGRFAEYLELVERVLASQRRWCLRRWVTIGLFTFAKMAMYRDLDTRKWSHRGGLEAHPILTDLLAGAEEQSEVMLATDYEIDAATMANRVHPLVTDADSSQHSAVIDVCDGKNLVIQGPPGTGKSQTITNIIAAAMNDGKRVLFVAEKMAALKVVKDRLDNLGLGAFCLEVHSNKTRKTSVLKSFEERLNLSGTFVDSRQLGQALEAFEQARSELIHYVNKMKEPVGETGLTTHEILRANSIRTPLGETLPSGLRKARIAEPTKVGPDRKDEVLALASDLESSAAGVDHWGGLTKHPWRGIETSDLDYFQIEELESELESWKEALRLLQERINDAARETEWPIESTAYGAEQFIIETLALPEAPDHVSDELIAEGSSKEGREHLKNVARWLEEKARLEQSLGLAFGGPVSLEAVSSSDLEKASRLAVQEGVEQLTVDGVERLVQHYEEVAKQMDASLPVITRFAELFGIAHLDVPTVGSIIDATAMLSEVVPNVLGLREPAVLAGENGKTLERGHQQSEALRGLKARVAADFRLNSLPPISELQSAVETLRDSGFFERIFGARYRTALRLYRSTVQQGTVRRKRAPAEELGRLVEFLSQKQALENDTELRGAAGASFRGLDTRWQDLLAIWRWGAKVQQSFAAENGINRRCSEVLLRGDLAVLIKIRALAKQDGGMQALKKFVELSGGSREPVEVVRETAYAKLDRTNVLALQLIELGLQPTVALGELPHIARKVRDLNATIDGLSRPESQRLLKNLDGPAASAASTLQLAAAFVEKVGGAKIPEATRRAVFGGSARRVIDLLKKHAGQLTDALNKAANHKRAATELGRIRPERWVGHADLNSAPIGELIGRIDYALANRQALQPYLQFLRIEEKAKSGALGSLLRYFEDASPPYGRLREAYDFIFFRSCAEWVLSADPRLKSHSGVTHEQLRKRYQQLDRKIMDLRRNEIVQKLSAARPPAGNSRGRASEFTELALIRRQIGLQRRHASLRDLFRRAGGAAQALKPCFMMSPMSVAQFLDPEGIRFDLVVMDEASQIRPEDALGALMRGKQIVVVGDPKQLPPTSFFERVDRDDPSDENSEEADIHDLTSQESILDLARGPYQPIRQLRWHYRSQHEMLIAFSNHEFYQDSLIVFPSPKGNNPDYGVRCVRVDGVYEAGLNRSEAEALTEAAQEFMRRFPERSLGIVAINKSQQELIQKMMDDLFATDADAESYRVRWEGTLNSVFVKNLENVQGDERDVIFISTVYGKDAHGNFFQRLGPINGMHGHRRLNVLFTRAKQQVRLFTSMRASDLRVEETTRWGVKALKNYLAFAEDGHLDIGELSGREPDSEFERWVMGMLQESGYEVVPQLGVAGYFIDLAVRDPEQNGSFILGIECDGASYHSARSVRDRDRLRQEVLERLNWTIYRIWSTDWFRNPRAEFQKLATVLHGLRRSRKDSKAY
jgi:very-short-patch-repair endonuclease